MANRAAAPATATRPAWRWALDLAAMVALLAAGIVGFGPAFGGTGYLVAAAGGLVLGLVIAVLGARFALNLFVLLAATLLAYLLFGGAFAVPASTLGGIVPTVDTVRQLALGIVFSWKDVLTLQIPVGGFPAVLIVPFLTTLVATVLAGSFALRLVRRAAWALVPAAALFVTAIVFGTRDAAAPVIQGLVFAGVALVWWAWRRAELRAAENQAGAGPARSVRIVRLASGAGLLVVALAFGAVAGGAIGAPASRDALRDQIDPPLDVKNYASPLVSFRKYVRDDKSNVLFSVEGLPDNARIRLATLDAYDGIVYSVAGDGSAASGTFQRISGEVPGTAAGTATHATLNVTIGDLSGVWMPDAGSLESLQFTGPRAAALTTTLHYNAATGVALTTDSLQKGDTYTADVAIPVVPSDDQLKSEQTTKLTMPKVTGVPDDIGTLATKYAGDAGDPLTEVRNIATSLSQGGFFSHGLEGEATSRAGHGEERIAALLAAAQMVGDDEQYSVAMALMVRELGLPARVVMGFYPDTYAGASATQNLTGDNLHAWVEVDFASSGWVAFDPTPPKDQVPTAEAPKPKSDPKAQVLQPPPPPQEPAQLPPDVRTDNSDQDQQPDAAGIPTYVYFAAGGGLLLLLILIAPLVVIGALKLRRRRRRETAARAADRLSGGWDEIVDRASDLGTLLPPGITRREGAVALADTYPIVSVIDVAQRADNGVFGPGEPSAADVSTFWNEVDAIVEGMTGSQSRWRRLKARLSLRSFRARRRAAQSNGKKQS
ncbi:transglutaminase-like domain-containing protein [Subtercola vilae]|uniref:Transglutaminase domain-containing protein n=1 Tax=Subtercola vilae TaxID=2056433 RepID=A0A4T2BR80_9MICO|nr:transglutaminase-like domain-containing protein [Subtercola vilae]TIH33740.1 transglutaminase domain-containing protein [Subtercola vilae]